MSIPGVRAAEHLGHAVSCAVTSDEVVKRDPDHLHAVFLILGFKGFALPRHRHYVPGFNSKEIVGVMVGVLLADADDFHAP